MDDRPIAEPIDQPVDANLEHELAGLAGVASVAGCRQRVLTGVHAELRAQRSDRLRARIAVSTFVIGVAANGWIMQQSASPGRQAAAIASREELREVKEIIAEVTDQETGRWFEQRLLAVLDRRHPHPDRETP